MDIMRTLVASVGVLAFVATGCGSSSEATWARPQVLHLGWRENCGTRVNPVPISTRRLVVGPRRWVVELAFRNETSTTLGVLQPHSPGMTYFGLSAFETASWREVVRRVETARDIYPRTIADRFEPTKPRLLAPGDSWSGSFSGPGRLPVDTPLRVVLGLFVIGEGKVPRGFARGFLCMSERAVRLR
jgi:hypothetical protein